MHPDVGARLRDWAARNERTLDAMLPPADAIPQRLHAAMRYATLGGGKRLRPCLVYAAGTACGAAVEALDHAAAAVELIHAYSLIHDDLPSMDDDALRRGKPTVHIAYDEATALLAGDALQALAFAALGAAPVAPAQVVAMLQTLSYAAGAPGMAGGQAIDLDAVGRQLDEAALSTMHAKKTGALIRAAVRLGALAAHADPTRMQLLDRYASALGLAFQIRDDILDVEGNAADLGKTVGKDAADGKPTYASLLGLDGARERLQQQVDAMHAALDGFDGDTTMLAALAEFSANRAR